MNVLIIDDESTMTDAISVRLDELSQRGDVIGTVGKYPANDFYRAREYLEQKIPFDLIIADLLMPRRGLGRIPDYNTKLNGWNFVYHYILREDGPYHSDCLETKIIFFSAYRERLEQHLIAENLMAYLREKRFVFVDKGYIYNEVGGFNVLMRTVKGLLSP